MSQRKKPSSKKRGNKKPAQMPSRWKYAFVLLFVALISFICGYLFSMVMSFDHFRSLFLKTEREIKIKTPEKPEPTRIAPTPPLFSSPFPVASKDLKKTSHHKLAIIIDDFGFDKNMAELFINLEYPLAISILPSQKYSEFSANLAKSKNKTVLLHLPMEPLEDENREPGMLLIGMKQDQIRSILLASLKTVPGAEGVNNHKGSAFSMDTESMQNFLLVLKELGLFFVDSQTSSDSKGYALARQLSIPCQKRDFFLDNVDQISEIRANMKKLKEFMLKSDQGIAIGHCRMNTLLVLKEMLPIIEDEGIRIVDIMEILEKH